MASLEGKVITLTGAASGIGAATARILASRGATLAVADINKDSLDRVVDSIKSQGHDRIDASIVDIRDRKAVKEWIQSTTEKHGPIDGCANIAGAIGRNQNVHFIWELSNEEYDFINDVNAKGLFNCLAEQLLPGVMKEGGSIASVASICGIKGLAKTSAYCGSKHAAVGLIRAAAIEAGPRNIRVNGVAPGSIETPMLNASYPGSEKPPPITPLARDGRPEEIGTTIAFLLSDESKFTSGAIYSVDGGWNC